MTADEAAVVHSRDEVLESALRALTDVVGDEGIPLAARRYCSAAHKALHACRSPEIVARMERGKGLR